MSNAEARLLVVLHFRAMDMAVYSGEQAVGKRSVPDLVVMDRFSGKLSRVRVMVGKRPRENGKLYIDQRRVGDHADLLAVVDPHSAQITFRASEAPYRWPGVSTPAGRVLHSQAA